MTYLQLAYIHLATVLLALTIGAVLMLIQKGSKPHRALGQIHMVLMLLTATLVLFMTAEVGPQLFGHFGFIHLFSPLTFYSVVQAWRAVRRGDIKTHQAYMVGLYCYGVLIAGSFALMPGRLLHRWLFG